MNLILDIDGITQGERARLTKKRSRLVMNLYKV